MQTETMKSGSRFLAYGQHFEIHDCCNCGCLFAVPKRVIKSRRDDGKPFFCPNGHSLVFTETTEKRLNKMLDMERMRRRDAELRANAARDQEEAARRQLSATRGVVTRIKNRVGRGICPCCNRSFENLKRHMASKHPDYKGND